MKLHPLSIPYRVVEMTMGLVWIFLLAGFVISSMTSGALVVVLFGLMIILSMVTVIAWQVAYHRRYEYELTSDTFDILSGVISRREREIPYGRIQNVSINRNVFQRALGIAEVRIETAGGGTTEAHLRYVGTSEADRLQDELSERKRTDRTIEEETAAQREPADLLFEIDTRELAVLGVVSLDARFIFLILFALSPFLPQIQNWLGQGAIVLFAIPVAIIVLYLITAAISAVYSVTNYYGFRLFHAEDELRYERGLLQRFSGTIPLEKVQAVTISENFLARTVGYASLLVETAGYSPGERGGSESAVPIARRERVIGLAHDVEPFEFPELQRPPKRARERYFFRYLGVIALLAGIVYAAGWMIGADYPWHYVLAGVPLAPVAAHLKWRHRGYALTGEHVLTRNGFWNRTIKIVPYHRIQTVIDSQTIFQRRRRLATLTIDTAGSQSLVSDESKAVDIDAATAHELREKVADRLLASLGKERSFRRRRREAIGRGRSDGNDPSDVKQNTTDRSGIRTTEPQTNERTERTPEEHNAEGRTGEEHTPEEGTAGEETGSVSTDGS